jgi:uncharacterized protein YfaS (alpha-2-macroglobulin family)
MLLAAGLASMVSSFARAEGFSHQGVTREAERYETWIKTSLKPGTAKARELRTAGDKLLANDPRGASRSYALAVATDTADSDAWLGLARSLLALPAAGLTGSERYEVPANASAAALRAYERAATPKGKATALAVLGEAFKRRSYWRPAIDALKASLDLADTPDVRATYAALRAEHGFRLIDYKSDVEAAEPRLCLQFSEAIANRENPADLAKFVTIDGKDPQSIVAEGKQLCLEGLAHGQRYQIQLKAGLPAENGEEILKSAEISAFMKDRAASVRFAGKSYVLPSRGQSGIPVLAINADKVAIEIFRVGDRSLAATLAGGDFQKQLSSHDIEQLKDRTGARIYTGELDVARKLNEEVATAVPIGEAIPRLEAGVYAMTARIAGAASNEDARATQWFIVSDLGLTALSGDDGIHVFVRSLASTSAAPGATVRLIARNNEVLGSAKTDAKGYARFEAGLKRGEGGMAPAVVVTEGANGDYAFLDLSTSAFDLTDRGVKGRDPAGALDAFLYADRGVFRPGETAQLSAIVRDRAGVASTLPMTLVVLRPDGVEHRRVALADQGLGGRHHPLVLGTSAMTGTWRVKLHADPKADPIATLAFLVEDFVPERLALTLTPPPAGLRIEEDGQVKLTAKYLYGPPAAGLAIEADVVVKPSSTALAGFEGFRFGRSEDKITPVRKALDGGGVTDANGGADVEVGLPPIPKTARPLEADVILRVREPGGRAIERTLTLPVDAKSARIGIKPLFKDDAVPENSEAEFELIRLGKDGKTTPPKAFKWSLSRLETRWQWYNRGGSWTYDTATSARRISSGTASPQGDRGLARIAVRGDWGRYRLEVTADDDKDVVSSIVFTSGWYADEGADSPETLDVALDKPRYVAGETAKLRIASRSGGRALVAVLGSGLKSTIEADIPKGGGEVQIPVDTSWGAGAYVTAMLYRPMEEAAKRMPSRALGLKWLALDTAPKTLAVTMQLPPQIRSAANLAVPVKIGGLKPGEDARLTLAAVDVGILNLTRFKDPSPEGWFHAQSKLGVEVRDLYGRLIDGMKAERGKLRSGGDGDGGGLSTSGSPPTEKLLALHSGIVQVGADGTAKVDFQLPEFTGAVRVMAVAWSRDKVGHAGGDVIVRDPMAVLASAPRFLTLGDEARIQLDLHNVDAPAGTYRAVVEAESAGGLKASIAGRDLALKTGERKAERIAIKPVRVGAHTFAIAITGPGDTLVTRRLTLDVKPPGGDIRRTTVSQISGKGGTLTLSPDLVADMINERTRVSVSVGAAAGLDVPGLLTELDRYPYGCAEQTTSRALPLLYANQLSLASALPRDAEIKGRIQGAIDRVLEMQEANGAFGIWGPRNGDIWLTAYVTDFLTRAKEQGFAVKPLAHAQALDRLANHLAAAEDFQKGGEERAYALYVLARNGRAQIGDARYFADARLDRFATPLAKAQLGAALAMLGDRERAEKVFRTALTGLDTVPQTESYRHDYGSHLRDGAAVVTLATESKIAREAAPRLATVLGKAFASRRYTSTQEQAWMLLAANALTDQARDTQLSIAGQSHKGAFTRSLSAAELVGGALTIRNDGDAATSALVSVIGAALTPEPATAKGFKLERQAFTMDGKPVDLKSLDGGASTLAQADRLVMVLKVEADEAGGRVLLVDRLPAGLEIENPRLVDGGEVKSLPWLTGGLRPEHTEFRDDRFVAAFDFSGRGRQNGDADAARGPQKAATVAYIVRAVTPGTFVHPAATVEDMYRPERHARSATGRLVVTAKE